MPELDFNQSEKWTNRLKDLVRGYPKGLGLIKEFLQNADDAGAKRLRVVFDRRTHPGQMPNAYMQKVLGPALVFWNDSVFSQEDFERIQDTGSGEKVDEASGTGRFGQGFNTSYSVSDEPSLLTTVNGTERVVAWFDPHRRSAVAWQNKTATNARAWTADDAPVELVPWLRAMWLPEWRKSEDVTGTLFRLPIRAPEDAPQSRIFPEPFLREEFDEIVDEFLKVGPSILVFLRNVLRVDVQEVLPDGLLVTRASISTLNGEDVEKARASVRQFCSGSPAKLLNSWKSRDVALPTVSYRHRFRISTESSPKEDEWAVVSGLYRGPKSQLLRTALDLCSAEEKAIPWAGAAVPVSPASRVGGGISCFLPLPVSVQHDVWIHGWFDLHSNRQDITRETGAGGKQALRVRWNRELYEHAVGPAWAQLMEALGVEEFIRGQQYGLWPVPPSDLSKRPMLKALHTGFYKAASCRSVFPRKHKDGYQLTPLSAPGGQLVGKKHQQRLEEPLVLSGFSVLSPRLPLHVHAALRNCGQSIPRVLPSEVKEHLKEKCKLVYVARTPEQATIPLLSQEEWIIAAIEYCGLNDKGKGWSAERLMDLPLALLADGKVYRLYRCRPLYHGDDVAKKVLEPFPRRRLNARLSGEVPRLKSAAVLHCFALSANGIGYLLKEAHNDGRRPDEEWIASCLRFLVGQKRAEIRGAETLQNVEFLPDEHGRLTPLGDRSALVQHCEREPSESILGCLYSLGVPILAASEPLKSAAAEFAKHCPGLLDFVDPGVVLKRLSLEPDCLSRMRGMGIEELRKFLKYLGGGIVVRSSSQGDPNAAHI